MEHTMIMCAIIGGVVVLLGILYVTLRLIPRTVATGWVNEDYSKIIEYAKLDILLACPNHNKWKVTRTKNKIIITFSEVDDTNLWLTDDAEA